MEILYHRFVHSMANLGLRPLLSTPISWRQASDSMCALQVPGPGSGSIMKLSSLTPTSPS